VQTPTLKPAVALLALAALTVGGGLSLAGWPEPEQALPFLGLLLGVVIVAGLPTRLSSRADAEAMRPSFVLEFAALLAIGPLPGVFVTAAGELAHQLAHEPRPSVSRRTVTPALLALVGIYAAGQTLQVAGEALDRETWPWVGIPMLAAIVVVSLVRVLTTRVVMPLLTGHPVSRTLPADLLRVAPPYVIAASLAAALAEVIAVERWDLLAVAAVPLYFVAAAYQRHLSRLDEEHRRAEVLDAFLQGMCFVGYHGRITVWSDTLARLVACPRDRAVGRTLTVALGALAGTPLPRVVEEVLRGGATRTVPAVTIPSAAGARTLQVQVVPVEGGATLLWHDITERTREEAVLRRSKEGLALAAEGANDGLWAWDLRRQETFYSSRWRAMLGLAAEAGSGRPEDWLERVHPDDLGPLKDALEAHLAGKTDHVRYEHRIRHQDGTYRWFLCRAVASRGASGRATRLAGSLTDRIEAAIAQDRLTGTGALDSLTGLANRAVFVERLGRRLADMKERRGGEQFAVLYLDLDRLKVVNDSLGHLIGDELLISVSRRLEACLRPTDLLARLGGDEFAVLLHALADEKQANVIAFRIQEALSAPVSIGGREVFTSASIGIALGRPQYENPGEIMRDADTAMYHAKARGKARHELFDEDMNARVRDRIGLENDLRHAVANLDFEVNYQPIVSLATGMCVGFESLIRWRRNGEPVSPGIFIPLAEELGLIEPVGTWVLREACRTFAVWRQQYPAAGLDFITVNVSSRQLQQHNFITIVERAVHDAGIQPADLRLEITETALMDRPHAAATLLRELRAFGVKIYLDDFGTGYSSLSHLHELPVDALKIDRSFVSSLQLADRPAIVESILALARTLNTSVVAEGIENDAQAQALERLGCTHAQGYLFARPLTPQAAEDLLCQRKPLGPKGAQPSRASTAEVAAALHPAPGPFTWPDHITVRPAKAEGGVPAFAHAS
jgi:diguanylate cyclase (GGDEF)-like protein/PAS domain S-box-containing protein